MNGWRSVISILTGVPPVPGSVFGSMLSGVVISDRSALVGARLTTPWSKSACSWPPISETTAGVTVPAARRS